MKKLILMAVGLLMAVISYSQENVRHYVASAYDTLTGNDTVYYTYPGKISTPFGWAIQHHSIKIAGTGAATYGIVQVSVDGTNWVTTDTVQTVSNSSAYATLVSTTTEEMACYIRLFCKQTGTSETTKQKGYIEIYPARRNWYSPAPPTYKLIDHAVLSNTDTELGAYPTQLNGVYAGSLQVTDEEVSGTATNTVVVQTSNDNTQWTTLATYTITTDTTIIRETTEGECGRYFRVYCTNSGTGVHHVDAYLQMYLRKY